MKINNADGKPLDLAGWYRENRTWLQSDCGEVLPVELASFSPQKQKRFKALYDFWMDVPQCGLSVDVYRTTGGDCTNGGISSKLTSLVVVGPGIPQITRHNGLNAVYIQRRQLGGQEYVSAVPLAVMDKWTMMGGNFIYSSDSRFRQLVNEYPVPMHDRVET